MAKCAGEDLNLVGLQSSYNLFNERPDHECTFSDQHELHGGLFMASKQGEHAEVS